MGRHDHRPHRLRAIVRTETVGRRLYLVLACGHRKLHNPQRALPRRGWCGECEPA